VPKGHLQHPDSQVQRRQCRHLGAQKPDHPEFQTEQSNFPELGQYICSRELIQEAIQDATMVEFRRLGSSLAGLSFGALLPGWVTNAWAIGGSTDGVSALSTLGGVVRSMSSTTDALSPGMVRTS
jgi:hypothetical protein